MGMKPSTIVTEAPMCCGRAVHIKKRTRRGMCHACFTYYQLAK